MNNKFTKSRWVICLAASACVFAGGAMFLAQASSSSARDAPDDRWLDAEPTDLERSGGDATVYVTNQNAFGKSLPTLPVARLRDFAFGNRLFNTQWVEAGASVETLDGLGPVFNRSSCSGCHTRDGRGRPPHAPDEPMTSMLIRLSMPGKGPHGGPKPIPNYGGQLNDRAILGVPPEGRCQITYEAVEGAFGDGEPYELRKPIYALTDLAFGELGEGAMLSPRVAPAVFGLGLLEAVDDATILQYADPDDADGDGISGRPNRVWDVQAGRTALGRFGWKANQPTLRQQVAGAFLGDIGITSSLFPDENIAQGQHQAAKAPHGGKPELSDEFLEKILFYSRTLAVPARRDVANPVVLRGQVIFENFDCAKCHRPVMQTGHDAQVVQLRHQVIRPYTDLLLHDMGPELADGRPDFEATGAEWRTPPLWGIGLQETVSRHTFFLHDGRARNLTEAILWHGGEAEAAREKFRTAPKDDRDALIQFLESL